MTLIDKGEKFVFKPLLYEVLNNTASEGEVAPSFAQVLAPYPIRFMQVSAVRSQALKGARRRLVHAHE